jgi:RsiW-degrading membrane proteinase PrsW (M82 family)
MKNKILKVLSLITIIIAVIFTILMFIVPSDSIAQSL